MAPRPKAAARKEDSHRRILAAASRRLRAEGLEDAGVAAIMAEAGLTHGGFYAHFPDKAALVAAALTAAMAESRESWTAELDRLTPDDALRQILGRYLSRAHREAPASGCPMGAAGSEIARAPLATRRAFEAALGQTAAALERHMAEAPDALSRERALATVALCLGGITLSRMVADPALADEILLACRRFAHAACLSSPPASR